MSDHIDAAHDAAFKIMAERREAKALQERRDSIEAEGAPPALARAAAGKRPRKVLLRLSEEDYLALRALADKFAEGNLTRWLTYAGLNARKAHLVDAWRMR